VDASSLFEGWCLLELMGHRKLAGYVTETTVAGAGFIRIDVPGPDVAAVATQLYAPAAVYAITPIAEDLARRFALACQPEPVSRWELSPASESSGL
jgi:hypothetical protein